MVKASPAKQFLSSSRGVIHDQGFAGYERVQACFCQDISRRKQTPCPNCLVSGTNSTTPPTRNLFIHSQSAAHRAGCTKQHHSCTSKQVSVQSEIQERRSRDEPQAKTKASTSRRHVRRMIYVSLCTLYAHKSGRCAHRIDICLIGRILYAPRASTGGAK